MLASGSPGYPLQPPAGRSSAQRRERCGCRCRCTCLRAALHILKDYCLNTSFHGLRFIADDNFHWTERLFWLACCLLSWYGSGLLIRASWDAFQNNAISFAVETNFLPWDTQFPMVGICERDSVQQIRGKRPPLPTEINGSHDYNLDEVITRLVFFSFATSFIASKCFINGEEYRPASNCPMNELYTLQYFYRRSCNEIFKECRWNNVTFPCCEQFLPLETELGVCYAFNSIHTNISTAKRIDTSSSQAKGLGTLYAEIYVSTTVYVLAQQELPTINTQDREKFPLNPGRHYRYWYNVKEVENDPGLAHTTLRQRGCRLEDEGISPRFPKYSYSSCVTQCRIDAMLRYCGCISHISPRTQPEESCNLTGLLCLDANKNNLLVSKPLNDPSRMGLYCNCAPSCDDQEITQVYSRSAGRNENTGILELILNSLPPVRFKRNVVRSELDLVVSMGGTCGLLVGASLLSFVELFYFFTLRACGTRRPAGSQPPSRPARPTPSAAPSKAEMLPPAGWPPAAVTVPVHKSHFVSVAPRPAAGKLHLEYF